MGLLDWFRPSPDKVLARARKALAAERWADARLDALDVLELPGAEEVVRIAEHHLLRINTEAAVSWAEAGDAERVRHHLELAGQFRRAEQPGDADVLVDARRRIQAIEAARQDEAAARARKEAASLAHVDPRFREVHAGPSIPLPEGVSEAEAEALEARLAMVLEGMPERHRADAIALGAEFLQAVLAREDGRPDEALQALLARGDRPEPILQHEMALSAMALGDPAAAARAWRAFAEANDGHDTLGDVHTEVALAEALARAGQHAEALQHVEAVRAVEPKQAGMLHAALLEATGQIAKADAVYREQLTLLGPHPQIYLAVAGLRVRAGKRHDAMAALEKSLQQSTCSTGSCGPRGPDLPTQRLLATLYLEDGLELPRALELADAAAAQVREPSWEDVYLKALADKARGEQDWPALAERLMAMLPEGDGRRQRVAALLPG